MLRISYNSYFELFSIQHMLLSCLRLKLFIINTLIIGKLLRNMSLLRRFIKEYIHAVVQENKNTVASVEAFLLDFTS